MRHIGSLIAGVVLAPLAWLLIAFGQEQSGTVVGKWVQNDSFNTADLVRPAAVLAAAGLLLGLIATLRTSPLGALVAGLGYAGTYLALFVEPLRVHSAVPGRLHWLGQTVHPRTPLDNGTLLVLGLLLLTAVVSAERWRGRRTAAADPDSASGEDRPVSPGGTATTTEQSSGTGNPSTTGGSTPAGSAAGQTGAFGGGESTVAAQRPGQQPTAGGKTR